MARRRTANFANIGGRFYASRRAYQNTKTGRFQPRYKLASGRDRSNARRRRSLGGSGG